MLEKSVMAAAIPLLLIAILAVFGLPTFGDSSLDRPPRTTSGSIPDGKVDGDLIRCAGGGTAQSTFERSGGAFRLAGTLMDKDEGSAVVSGPAGDVMVLLPSGVVASGFIVGDPVSVSGSIDESERLVASELSPICAPSDAFILEPPVTSAPSAPEVDPRTHPPAQSGEVTVDSPDAGEDGEERDAPRGRENRDDKEDKDEEDDDDRRDKPGRGHGREGDD